MGAGVDDGEQQHGIRSLAVEPLALVQRQELDFRPQKAEDVAAHGQQDQPAVQSQTQAGSARYPHGIAERVEPGQPLVGHLAVPVGLLARAGFGGARWVCTYHP